MLITAALLGQMKLTKPQAESAAKLFGLSKGEELLLKKVPYRGSIPALPPTDPLIYRFYELAMVYGSTWKELIQEEFDDGIMSAIDVEATASRSAYRISLMATPQTRPNTATERIERLPRRRRR